MSKRFLRRTAMGAVFLLPVALLFFAYANATPPGAGSNAGAGESGRSDPQSAERAAAAKRYEVPETNDVQQLIDYIDSLKAYEPTSYPDSLRHRALGPEAAFKAAKKIVELKPEEGSDAHKLATGIILYHRVATVGEASDAERAAVIKEAIDRVASKKAEEVERRDVGLVIRMADILERTGHFEEATQVNRTFGKHFSVSSDPDLAGLGREFQASARRTSLPGHEMKLEGTTFEGEKFDWESYRGKVVLVDFWATWCGPCLASMPNIKRIHERYSDRGFDVVGISIDDDRGALGAFLAREQLPWTTLHEAGASGHPIADHYGIMAIPTTVVVDRKGKVVALDVHGVELERMIEDLLGGEEASKEEDT